MKNLDCREVVWEEWVTSGRESSWGYRLLGVMMENAMTQRVTENMRFTGDVEPSRFELVFAKEPKIVSKIEYTHPFNKSEHVLIQMK